MSEVFKRKWRWTLGGDLPGGRLEPVFVKVAARPTLNIEETEIAPGNWVPGKTSWDTLTVTAWEPSDEFWGVIMKSLHEGEDPPPEVMGTFKLTLYDGCGYALEEWELGEAYIPAIKFMELDHSSSEVVDVEMTVKYKNAKYKALADAGQCLPSTGKTGMGIGNLGGSKVVCPQCKHEFFSYQPSIVY